MERIGRYQIVRELGRGSMSIVYEGFDGRIDRHLAIKVLRARYARDVSARQRFLREARAAGGLSHPNIVTVFDVGQAESAPYLVMELLEGGTLESWLEREPAEELEISQLLELAVQLARGLAYAHDNGVIHRDIKPANVHYDPSANLAKMMDFGIAATGARCTGDGGSPDFAGTLTHMAPERLEGEPASVQSDLYSLGVLLYELLCGRLPFEADDVPTLVDNIASRKMRPLEPTRADTPRELVDLTRRMMAHEPQSRPTSAAQVADELEEIRAGLRRGLVESVRRKSAVWRWPVLTALGVSLILVLGMAQFYNAQKQAMAQTTFGFGDALASLVAQETAESLILEDNTALSVLVSDFAANPEIRYLHITDTSDLIQASTNPFLRGEQAPPPPGAPVERDSGSVQLRRSDDSVLEFSVPIRFQARRVGEVRLGLDGAALDAAVASTLWMLIMIFVAALLALAIALAWMTRRQQRALSRLAWGLKRLRRGQYEFRLETDRRDEFLQANSQFNRLAVRLDEGRRKRVATTDRKRSEAPVIPDDVRVDETLDLEDAPETGGDVDPEADAAPSSDDSPAKVTRLRRP
jgi:serine/threonine-protein kinase